MTTRPRWRRRRRAINVPTVNAARVADDNTITVAEESTGTSLGLTAPTDADDASLTITVTGLPSAGTVTLADGTTAVSAGQTLTVAQLTGLKYTAPADLASATAYTFTYSVSDGNSTDTGTATINVTTVNDAPVADDNTITVAEEWTGTSLGLTAPTDADDASLTITVTGLPSAGTVTLADGTTAVSAGQTLTVAQLTGLKYTAPADLASATAYTFTYSVSDGNSTDTGTATINVTTVNDAPAADDNTTTVAEEAAGDQRADGERRAGCR